MALYEIVPDGWGGLYLKEVTGNLFAILMFIGLSIFGATFLVFVLEKVYSNGENIMVFFGFVTVLFLLEEMFKKKKGPGILFWFHGFVASPLLMLYLYAGLTYWTTFIEDMAYSSVWGGALFFIAYIVLGPAISLVTGMTVTMILSFITNLLPTRSKLFPTRYPR